MIQNVYVVATHFLIHFLVDTGCDFSRLNMRNGIATPWGRCTLNFIRIASLHSDCAVDASKGVLGEFRCSVSAAPLVLVVSFVTQRG